MVKPAFDKHLYVVFVYVCFISGNPHLKAVELFSEVFSWVPQVVWCHRITWTARGMQRCKRHSGYLKRWDTWRDLFSLEGVYLPFKIWMGLFAIKTPLYLWDTIHSQMKRTNVLTCFFLLKKSMFFFSLYGRMAIVSSAMLLEMFSSISHDIGVFSGDDSYKWNGEPLQEENYMKMWNLKAYIVGYCTKAIWQNRSKSFQKPCLNRYPNPETFFWSHMRPYQMDD